MVEDDPKVGSFLTQSLRAEAYLVDWATTAEDAVARAARGHFDLILLDRVPGRPNGDLMRRLHADGSSVPILVLTAQESADERRVALGAGAHDTLAKPFRLEVLLQRIRDLLDV